MEGTERIDYTEQSSTGWKGRMWTDGTKEELAKRRSFLQPTT